MSNDKIYVIHSGSTIESLYTLFPLIVSRYNSRLVYIHVDSKEACSVSGRTVILVRVFKGNKLYSADDQKKRDYITALRKRFDRVIMLDDGAGSDSLHFEYMDLVDLYYKGKLLRNKGNYLSPVYGRQIFTDFYHHHAGINDEHVKIREAPGNMDLLQKLRISWNLGYGLYPIPGKTLVRIAKHFTKYGFTGKLRPWFTFSYKKMIKMLDRPIDLSGKLKKVQARFGDKDLPPTIGYQRKLFLQLCSGTDLVLSGKINAGDYIREMNTILAVLSPFGWGEVCFRDFESILSGSILIKPDMDHLDTWPDLFQSETTYVAVDWEGNNLVDILQRVTGDPGSYRHIAETARVTYRNALLNMDERISRFLTEATAETPAYGFAGTEILTG